MNISIVRISRAAGSTASLDRESLCADELSELATAGIVLEDRPGGKTEWRRAR